MGHKIPHNVSATRPTPDPTERFTGLLLGTAVGDALGLPAENLSAEKIRRRWRGQWKMRLIFGRGMISDDTEHTLMVAQALLAHPGDFRAALVSALECGGDTDTVGAVLGALAGVSVGKPGIPIEWLNTICDWPRSVSVMEQIAARLARQETTGHPCGPVQYFWPGLIRRNLLFLTTILVHGFRRLLPPY
jgi:ADP-ribosylglycohydrolase